MSPRQQAAPVHRHTAAVVATAARRAARRSQPAWPELPTILPTRWRAKASSTSAASPPSSTAAPIMAGQMYVDVRIPAKQTQRYPIIMVHGGTRSATTYFGTPDGREGWAQYFVRQGYAVYVVDQPGRGRSGYLAEAYGPWKVPDRGWRSAPLSLAGQVQTVAAGASAHAMAGQRRARRRRHTADDRQVTCRRSGISPNSNSSTATHWWR